MILINLKFESELQEVFMKTGQNYSKEQIKRMISSVDYDKNGMVM